GAALSRSAAPHRLLRCRQGLATDLPDQQFSPSPSHHRPIVPGTLADRIVLPLDQTAPAHPSFLRHLRERREDASVGGTLGLRAGGHRQKATGAGPESPPNSPNSRCHDFRKNPDFRGIFQFHRRLLRRGDWYPIEPFRLTLGRYCFRMIVENPTWGAPRIHGELLMLGFDLCERTISRWMKRGPRDPEPAQRWLAFLRNHREAIAAMDFFTVPTITFGVLYGFFVISHGRRRILHFNVTKHPTSLWVVQQLREAFPFELAPRFLIFDRDAKYGLEVLGL